MRRSAIIVLAICGAFLVSAGLTGCGSSSNKNNPNTPASITLTPTTASLEPGGVTQLLATVKNSDGVVLFQAITFTSSATPIASVASGGNSPGLVCAGSWDSATTPVVCTPGSTGTATITATVAGLSATATIYVHQHITSITLNPGSVNCDSQKLTTAFSATAFNGATDITNTVGPFTWASSDTNVVTIASNTSNPAILNLATATAVNPGQTTVFATAGGTNSVPSNFITCPVVLVRAHLFTSSATTFTIAVGGTQQLAGDEVDSLGTVVTVPLTWTSSSPPTATVNSNALVTGVAAGGVGITASCSPPTCNNGLNTPVYSNVVSGTVTGTAAAQTVYATSSLLNPACSTAGSNTCTSVVPITTNNNTAGTAITLPANQVPNSLAFDAAGASGYLGSSAGLMVLNPSNNSISGTVTNALGKILAVSPNGNFVIVANPGVDVTVFNPPNNTVQTLNIPNAAAADFSPDSLKAYIVGGSTLYVFQPGLALRTIALAGAANDVNFLSTGGFAYLAGGGSPVTVRATCDNSQQDTVATAATPTFIRRAPGTLNMAAVDSPNLEIITASPTTPPPPACPPTLSDALTTVNTGVPFTPNALIVTPDGSKALITSNLAEVTMVNLGTNAVTHIALTGGANAFTGGVTLDSKTLYAGASDGKVHVIDLTAGTDSATPITITFPNQAAGIAVDLVAIRP
ncbi:MAG TPA: hypothetical protein VEG08_00200 [Terriglobales bacterium]|nr:hypothetical protein [Terriglobales bacterium]